MNYQTVKGMKDFLPEEMMVRKKIFETAQTVLTKYGFAPLDTPALEYEETLTAKSGEDVKKELFAFKDKGGRKVGLRFDLTVPTSRVLANNPQLIMPFKRYQYGKAWRYGEIKKGRYREFYQFDIDSFGSNSMMADAEIITAVLEVYKKLGLNIIMRVNNRKILADMMDYSGIPKKLWQEAFRSIDKLDKVGLKGVEKELIDRGISKESCKKIIRLIGTDSLEKLKKILGGCKGIKELEELTGYLKSFNVKNYVIDVSLARGLDYYTGPVFEASCKDIKVSVGGGGRYDNLIKILSGRDVSATGFSLGIEPIFELLKSKSKQASSTKVFVASVKPEFDKKVVGLAQKMRKAGMNVETDLMGRSLKKQLDYVSKKGIPFVLIIGEKELKEKKFTVRDMKTGKQQKTSFEGMMKLFGKG